MAKVFLETDDSFTIGSSSQIFGADGTESVFIYSNTIGINVDQNIERVDFLDTKVADLKFQQTGNQIRVFKDDELVLTVTLQADTDGTQIVFTDGSVNAKLTEGVIYLGGTVVQSNSPRSVIPATIDKEIISGSNNSQPTNPNLSHTNYGLGDISTLDSTGVSSIDSTTHWDRKELTYSFNQSIPDSYYNYPEDGLTDNWHELNQAQKDTVNSITQEINSLLDIKLTKVADGGDIRFNMVDMPENQAGFSFYPSDNPDYGGDVFLSNDFNSDSQYYGLDRGEDGWMIIAHELGHALGLKHPFENPNRLPSNQDDINHTVMSYTPKDNITPIFTTEGSSVRLEYHLLYPNLYSLYDISALQAIYGANTTTNGGDDVYSTKYSDYKIQTIWDTSGEDIIELSNTKGKTTIDLRGGSINSVDEYSLEDIIKLHQDEVGGGSQANSWIRDNITTLYNDNELYTGKNSFSIAEGVIIENIKTGSGDDIIIDNSVDNSIYTNGGDDKIYIGNGGYDYINGGDGEDTLYIDLTKDKIKVEQTGTGDYILTTDSFGAELVGVENIYLSDNNIYTPQDLIA